MKKSIVTAYLVSLALLGACTIETSFGSEGYNSKLSVRVNGNHKDGSISEGGYLTLKIIGEDYDGISSIDVLIPAIGVDQEFVNNSRNERWEINQTFQVDTIYADVSREIHVTLTDTDGDIYTKTLRLKVHE
ncbi:MAG: hypothetical protein AB3N16_01825 [Flavobacteriaceae bacterium]